MQHMYCYYKERKENYDLHFRTILLIVARLSSTYLECKDYDEALFYINEGIRMSIIRGNQKLLSGLVNNKAHALECCKQKEFSLKYCRLAYYCADLIEANIIDIAKRSYETLANVHRDGINIRPFPNRVRFHSNYYQEYILCIVSCNCYSRKDCYSKNIRDN